MNWLPKYCILIVSHAALVVAGNSEWERIPFQLQQEQELENRIFHQEIVVGNENNLSRRLVDEPKIFKYAPKTSVIDQAAIDLDQNDIKNQLNRKTELSFDNAYQVYLLGAHSMSYAYIKLDEPLLFTAMKDNTEVMGYDNDNNQIFGKILSDMRANSTFLRFQYQIISSSSSTTTNHHVGCMVGKTKDPFTDGCLKSIGNVTIRSVDESIGQDQSQTISYVFNKMNDNHNDRTIQKFSTEAKMHMYQCSNNNVNNNLQTFTRTCPYNVYNQFYNFYNMNAYADEFITAAFGKRKTLFSNGNTDFTDISDDGKAEVIKIATVSMNIWMHVIYKMEYAVDLLCYNYNQDNGMDFYYHPWDEAVAFYTGSLVENSLSDGVLLYGQANEACKYFITCGYHGNSSTGTAKINHDVFEQFIYGSRNITTAKCNQLRASKDRIIKLMTVPLVQNILRYAYYRGNLGDMSSETHVVGSTYVSSIMPMLHKCNPADADIIYDNMKYNDKDEFKMKPTNFYAVKGALERQYKCLGITCKDVGGLKLFDKTIHGTMVDNDEQQHTYFAGAEPCIELSKLGISEDTTTTTNDHDSSNYIRTPPSSKQQPATTVQNNGVGGSTTYRNSLSRERIARIRAFMLGIGIGGFILAIVITLLCNCCWPTTESDTSN